jgi:hypothetical protein
MQPYLGSLEHEVYMQHMPLNMHSLEVGGGAVGAAIFAARRPGRGATGQHQHVRRASRQGRRPRPGTKDW